MMPATGAESPDGILCFVTHCFGRTAAKLGDLCVELTKSTDQLASLRLQGCDLSEALAACVLILQARAFMHARETRGAELAAPEIEISERAMQPAAVTIPRHRQILLAKLAVELKKALFSPDLLVFHRGGSG